MGLSEVLRGASKLMAGALRRAASCVGLSPADATETHERRLGRRAEKEAARYLKRQGWRVLERNFRCRQGEIDLVAFRVGTVAFVEVRARMEPIDIDPLYTVTRSKQQRLIQAAQQYASLHSLREHDLVLRFDVMALRYDRSGRLRDTVHIENAFTL